jgi:hypothetical protein
MATRDFLCSADSRILLKVHEPPTAVIVSSSVETLRDRCFEGCSKMTAITFEDCAKLRRIGERAFASCPLQSITIPASTEEIDGSAFVQCPLQMITVAPGNQNFRIEGNALITSDGTKIVRHIGNELEIIVSRTVEIFGKLCFEDAVSRKEFFLRMTLNCE